ncbi:hypothetical protein JCM21714_2093 [Gracilibacillus boraciitolerans JCM 21714]|uniref:Uncharacterized protein n=1 Tax=Gracilibacillus boraciitolerans JCM 21714 TaxID=1298598 RepID=W4VJR1_9BACI|nr:hypothetical protein [Gracilibacillus boraciitolerans]GAE93058.1 hypothetical protein JCM21714_2093 [Gracilibacillus boraciitolerans JCM 21714]
MYMQNHFMVKGEKIPYYHFFYKENLHVLLHRKKYFKEREKFKLENGLCLGDFLVEETKKQFNETADFPIIDKSVVFIIHHFEDRVKRDMDNFVYKPLIDAVVKTCIIPEDNYEHVSPYYYGKSSICNMVELLVIPFYHYLDFCDQKMESIINEYRYKQNIYTVSEWQEKIRKEKEELHTFFEM